MTEEIGTPAGHTSRPSSAEIRQELVVLRQRDGASTSKIRDQCKALQRLPAVDNEVQRRGLHPDDTHVAAYDVVLCAVAAIPRADLSNIARITLNLQNDTGGLDHRRDYVMRTMYLTLKEYQRLEQLSYSELANRLVAAQRSPCLDPPSRDTLDDFGLQLVIPGEQLARILQFLTIEDRQALRTKLWDALMDRLPRGKATFASIEPVFPDHIGNIVISLVLRNAWPPERLSPARDYLLVEGETLDTILAEPDPQRGQASEWSARHSDAFERWTKSPLKFLSTSPEAESFYERLHVSLTMLAAELKAIEVDGDWQRYAEAAGISSDVLT